MKNKEFKLGIFIFGALVILILGIFSIKDFRVFNPGYTIKVMFNFGDGIKPASPVRIAGVDAGEVKKTSLVHEDGKTKVLVRAWIRSGIKIPVGSEAFVNNLGILGEKYLEIIPNDEAAEYVKKNDIIIGKDSIPMYKMGEFARETLSRFARLLDSLENIVKDEEVAVAFKKFIGNLEQASFELDGILKDVRSSKGTIGKLLYEDALYKELEEFVKDLKEHPWKLLHKPKKTRTSRSREKK